MPEESVFCYWIGQCCYYLKTNKLLFILCLWRSESNLQELVLVYHMGSREQTQVVRKHFYLLNYLPSLSYENLLPINQFRFMPHVVNIILTNSSTFASTSNLYRMIMLRSNHIVRSNHISIMTGICLSIDSLIVKLLRVCVYLYSGCWYLQLELHVVVSHIKCVLDWTCSSARRASAPNCSAFSPALTLSLFCSCFRHWWDSTTVRAANLQRKWVTVY